MIGAVVTGADFLDWTGPGGARALFVDAEQGLRTVKRRLREARLAQLEAIDYLHVPDGLALDSDQEQIAAVEQILAAEWGLLFDREQGFRRAPEDEVDADEQLAQRLIEVVREQPGLSTKKVTDAVEGRKATLTRILRSDDRFRSERRGQADLWFDADTESLFPRDGNRAEHVVRAEDDHPVPADGNTPLGGIRRERVRRLLFPRSRNHDLRLRPDPRPRGQHPVLLPSSLGADLRPRPRERAGTQARHLLHRRSNGVRPVRRRPQVDLDVRRVRAAAHPARRLDRHARRRAVAHRGDTVTARRLCSYPRCGRIAQPGTYRCQEHPKRRVPRHRQYRNLCAAIKANATFCGICGEGPRTDDPWVVDHIVPRARGGSDDPTNLQAAHRSCNGRKGAGIGEGIW
jgi:5-methylcytosine-specific restriction endonuclease McrA